MPLIAYNINLNTDRLDVAKKIAAAIRHSSGGLRYVKAMGVKLDDRNLAQVSMNLTNYEKTPIFRVFEMVKREAERYGVSILESEIVGLVPAAALVVDGRVLPADRAVQRGSDSGEQTATANLRPSGTPTEPFRPLPLPLRDAACGTMPNARIFRYRLLRSTPSASAVREMLPCWAASARRM